MQGGKKLIEKREEFSYKKREDEKKLKKNSNEQN